MNQNKANYSLVHMLARGYLPPVIFPYTVFYILWFHYLEMTVTGNYLVMHTHLDKLILFLPVFTVPYLLWLIYIFTALLYSSRADRDEAADFCLFLSPDMTVAFFIYTVFPNGAGLRVPMGPADGFFASLVRITQSTGMPIDMLSSIHVFNALTVHVTVTRSHSLTHHPLVQHVSLTLMLLICLSTIFLRQHSVLDVFDVLLLDYFVNAAIYGSYEVPILTPVGTDVLFRRKKNPAKAYRQFRKKQEETNSPEVLQTLLDLSISIKTVELLYDFIARNVDFSTTLARQIHVLSERVETNAEAEPWILLP